MHGIRNLPYYGWSVEFNNARHLQACMLIGSTAWMHGLIARAAK
jgi:hypothetical protein